MLKTNIKCIAVTFLTIGNVSNWWKNANSFRFQLMQ